MRIEFRTLLLTSFVCCFLLIGCNNEMNGTLHSLEFIINGGMRDANVSLRSANISMRSANVKLFNGTVIKTSIDVPEGTLLKIGAQVRIERNGDEWIITEVLN